MAKRFVTAREQFELLSPWRIAMPWYHNTDAELNPGDEVVPAAERGYKSQWQNSNYDPHSVYFTKEDNDDNAEYWRGRNRYEVEPIGEVRRDPEFYDNAKDHYENEVDWENGGKYSEDEVEGSNSYMAPRARVVRKLPLHRYWTGEHKTAMPSWYASRLASRLAMPEHQLSEQIFNGDGEPNEAHHGGWAEMALDRRGLTGKTFHVPSAYKDVDPAHPDRWALTQKLQRQHSSEAENYVNGVLEKNGWDRGPITVKPEDWHTRQRGAIASYAPGKYQIGLKGNHVTELTLLHEMAHALLDTTHENYHGHEFKSQLHDLIHQNLGEEAGNIYGDIGFRDISPNQLALPLFKRDRTAAVHDRLMQIVAMADTTPWHPHIIEHRVRDSDGGIRGTSKDRAYVIRKPRPKDEMSRAGDQAIAQLEVTIHSKGDRQWKSNMDGFGGGYVPREHNEAYINSIIVHPDFQGQGIAQALIERLNKDYPQHKINPGVTTPKGYGLVERLKKLIPDSEEKMSPDYKPYVMDDEESAEYESSEYANVGHEDYVEDDYISEYNPRNKTEQPTENTYVINFGEEPRSRQLVNASYDDGPYWGAAWDDEDDDDEDDWPEGTPKRKHASEKLAGKSGELPEGIKFSHGKMFDGRDAVQAHIGDKLVGQLQWDSRNPKRGFDNDINYITVHPEYRRRGIGSAMYQHAVQNIDPHLLPGSLDVTPSGRGLSKSLGFKPKDQGTYYDGTPMKFNLSPVRDDGNDWPDASVGNGWQWDEKFNHRSKDRFSRLFLAMAWNDWAPHIQGGCDNCNHDKLLGGRGEYFIEHEKGDEDFHGFKKSTLDFYHDVNGDGQPTIYIQGIQTNPHYRHDGVAESLMRKLHEDHPDTHINTGIMTDDGEEFYERMLEKEPGARDFTSARFWRTSMPAPAPEGLRFQPGTPRSKGLGRVDAYVGDDPVGHLEWLDDDNPWSIVTPRKPGEVSHIYVHPNVRRQSVATEMFDHVKNNVRPDLHHSERRTNLGDSWVDYEQNRVASQRFWNAS